MKSFIAKSIFIFILLGAYQHFFSHKYEFYENTIGQARVRANKITGQVEYRDAFGWN